MKKGIFLLLFVYSHSYAKTVTNQINDLLLYQEQKKVYHEQKNNHKKQIYNYTKLKTIPIEEDTKEEKSCIKIDKINFDGITLLSKSELYDIKKPYLHRCSSIKQLQTIVKKINNLYIKKAYITSRAYIKPQNLSKGKLTISAIEGRIQSVRGDGVSTKLIFPFVEDTNLNLRDLENGIEQINRLSSKHATMKLYPASKNGYTNVVIKSQKDTKSYYADVGINNFGVKKTGQYQINAAFNLEDTFGINDLLSISVNSTDKHTSKVNSLGSSLSYAFPVGKSYMGVRYSIYDFKQNIHGKNQDYQSSGKTKNTELFLEYKLFHSQINRAKLDISLSKKENDNYLAGVYLKSSSNVLTVLRVGYTQNFELTSWNAYTIFKYHKGLDLFGAKSIRDDLLKFDKYTLDMSFNKRFKTKTPLVFRSSLHAQYAKDGLISTEYISVGGPYSVRGFKNEYTLSGNSGLYLRNEISPTYRFRWGMISLYLGVDYGWIKTNEYSNGGSLVGAVIGTKISIKNFQVDIYKSHPLRDSNNHDKNDGFVGLSLNYRF